MPTVLCQTEWQNPGICEDRLFWQASSVPHYATIDSHGNDIRPLVGGSKSLVLVSSEKAPPSERPIQGLLA